MSGASSLSSATASDKRRSVLALIGTAVLWSSAGVLVKGVNWHPLAISGTRSLIAAVTMRIAARQPRFDWSAAQVGGAVSYAATVTLFIAATRLTTAANAVLLQYTAPIWVAVLGAWFLGERATGRDVASIAVALLGMGLLFYGGLGRGFPAGDLLAILSGFSKACLTMFLRRQKSRAPLESVLLGSILAALIGVPFALVTDGPDLGGWAALFALGSLQSGLAFVLYTSAIRHTRALDAVMITMLEPVLNPIWVYLVVGERPEGLALIGGMLVMISVVVRALSTAAAGMGKGSVAQLGAEGASG